MSGRDWVDWHQGYDDPASSLSTRLPVVRRYVGEALDTLGPGRRRILSLCAGDGRDVLPVLAERSEAEVAAVLVELEPSLADGARTRAESLGLTGIEVRTADAGDPAVFADHLPVDLLLLCGIFGNVVDADIRTTLDAVPSMVAAGGFAIWTRGAFAHGDLRPEVRAWSGAAGLTEVAYDGEPAEHGVGLYRVEATASAPLPGRLFSFVR